MVYSETSAEAVGTFTLNKAKAAPVIISEEIIKKGEKVKAIIINSGNANACTGIEGYLDALEVQKECAAVFGLNQAKVLVSSTGVIGKKLNVAAILNSLDLLKNNLSSTGGLNAAEAIMTTDLHPKHFALKVKLSKGEVTIGGIAKGSGMIMPNMATMLGFITSDAEINHAVLQSALTEAVNDSFNKISVDGETSTNDMVIMLANGRSKIKVEEDSEDYQLFVFALKDISVKMAKAIVADGEGATKLITLNVINAPTDYDANLIAKSIANSPLVKTAINGEDPNWGRIISAASSCGANILPENVTLYFDNLAVVKPKYKIITDEKEVTNILTHKEITITLDLDNGNACTTWWTCDYSEKYIKINANYRT